MTQHKTAAGNPTPADGTPDGKGTRSLDPTSRSSIENRLKSMYDEVASAPVPDRFLDLLNRLERSETTEGGQGAAQ